MLKRLLSAISLAVVVLAAQAASAGVTIHYEGTAKDLPSARRAIEAARAEARKLGWVVQDANQATVTILRVIGEAEKPYTGPLTGVVIRPHPNCDPLFLQFGSDLYLQDFVKTQFAGPDTHIAIVGLLKTLQPFFRSLAPHLHGATLSHDRSPLWASSPLFLAADSFGLRRETGLLIPSRYARR